MKTMFRNIVAALVCAALSHSAHAESPKVVATISPLHSLASALMAGTDSTPHMLAGKGDSPHHFHLRPSGAELLEEADLIFWVSENLETALSKPISARARPGASIELLPTLDPHSLIHYDEGDDGHEGHDDHAEHDDTPTMTSMTTMPATTSMTTTPTMTTMATTTTTRTSIGRTTTTAMATSMRMSIGKTATTTTPATIMAALTRTYGCRRS